jgi:hypothetical protein
VFEDVGSSQQWNAMIKALQDFASANPAAFTAIAVLASSMTALAAVIITPILTYLNARKQIRANLVSANRQAWIDALRDELAELFELLTWQFHLRPGTYSGEEGFRYEAEKRSRIRLLTNKIRLRLNPNESDAQVLLGYLDKLQLFDESIFHELMEKAVAKGQDILKTEWKRVKKGQ